MGQCKVHSYAFNKMDTKSALISKYNLDLGWILTNSYYSSVHHFKIEMKISKRKTIATFIIDKTFIQNIKV